MKNAIRDKKAFANQLAKEAEETANKCDMGALHKITRRLCGACQKFSTVVRDGRGEYFPRTLSRRHGGSNTSKCSKSALFSEHGDITSCF